jgi:4'-phosphopantetheinyl transferase
MLVGKGPDIDNRAMGQDIPPRLEWRPAARGLPPDEHSLHLWRLDLDDEVGWDDAAALEALSDAQRDRHARLQLALHRQRYLRSQFGCRLALAAYLGLSAAEVRYQYGAAGKPELAQDLPGAELGLHFNLTTSHDLALVAVSRRWPVGVDTERLRPRADMHAVARRMFTPEAASALTALPSQDQLPIFYRHWTALESRVKADGRGLSRHREPDLPGLQVAHFDLLSRAGDEFICAIARQHMPSPSRWQAFKPDHRVGR